MLLVMLFLMLFLCKFQPHEFLDLVQHVLCLELTYIRTVLLLPPETCAEGT